MQNVKFSEQPFAIFLELVRSKPEKFQSILSVYGIEFYEFSAITIYNLLHSITNSNDTSLPSVMFPIGESLLTSLFTFFLISIQLNS